MADSKWGILCIITCVLLAKTNVLVPAAACGLWFVLYPLFNLTSIFAPHSWAKVVIPVVAGIAFVIRMH